MKFFLLFFPSWLGIVVSLQSQSLSYTSYTTKDGIPSNIITAIFQDSKGYLWIGTNNGLAKYDGAEFTIYSTLNGLSNNWITTIKENPFQPGSIWVGTIAGGVNKYQNGVFHSYKFGSNPDWNNVSGCCIDKKGVVWIVVKNGFLKISDDSIKIVSDEDSPKNPDIIYSTKDGNILCSEGNHIFIHNPDYSSWTKLDLQLPKTSVITSIIQDSEGKIWFGTSDKLIIELYDLGIVRKEKTKYGIPYQLQDDGHGSLLIRDRDIFFSISKEKLLYQKILPLPENKEMPEDVTSPFLIDTEGNIWIGTWLKGLLKISDLSLYHFKFYSTSKLSWTSIDRQGNIWTGTNGGVWEVYLNKENQWQKEFHRIIDFAGDSKIYISSIDSQNNLWLNLKGKTSVYKIINREFSSSTLASANMKNLLHLINKGTLLALYDDKQNRLWFSTAESGVGAVDLKTGKLIKFYTVEDGIPGVAVRAIFQDSKNQIWMGGWQQGISIFSNNPLPSLKRKITIADGLPDNMIRSIYEDDSGKMWIGTRHNGVVIIENELNKSCKNISMKDGLLSNSIWGIIEGPDNKMWLNTDVGIEEIDIRTLKVLPPKKEFLVSFDQSLSLGSYKSKLWCFSSNEELFIYENQNRKRETIFPPVVITNITVNGNDFSDAGLSDLSYTQNNITIKFTGLSFKEEQAVTYQYRLIGTSDTNWTSPSNHRNISFASLAPGKYLFEVHAINSDGVRSKSPAVLSFIILPPFWLQWWFIAFIILILSGFIFSIYRFRVKRLFEMERLRTRIASDLHDDVGTNLSSIILSSQIIEKKFSFGAEEKEYLHQLSSIASKTQDVLKETVWLLNPMNDSFADLVLRLKSIASQTLQEISFSFTSDENLRHEKLSLEVKRNILLMFKEILQNIIKHSSANTVKIEIRKDKDSLVLKISDDGIGFNINEVKRGNGLTNLFFRTKAIAGKLDIDSKTGQGTEVELKLNITQMRTGRKAVAGLT